MFTPYENHPRTIPSLPPLAVQKWSPMKLVPQKVGDCRRPPGFYLLVPKEHRDLGNVYIYVNAAFFICPTLSFPLFVHKSLLYICVHSFTENRLIYGIIYSGILRSHRKKKTPESLLVRWLNLEHVIQSEESQNEEDKYGILMHT